jgi:hypothetical protein
MSAGPSVTLFFAPELDKVLALVLDLVSDDSPLQIAVHKALGGAVRRAIS